MFYNHHHGGRSCHPGARGGFGPGPGWGRGMRGGGGRGGPGGRGRMFDGGELRLVLLRLIGDEPRHGYDLIRAIEELTGGAYAPSPGVVYPTLTLLADMGWVEEQPDGTRKRFAVTEAGREQLETASDQVEALIARLTEIGKLREKTDATSIRRAMMNLREVLQNRLSGEDVDAETLHQVVALIDEAAQKIERL